MIRIATQEEAVEIATHPEIVKRLDGVVADHFIHQPWIVDNGGMQMLFIFWTEPKESKTVEVHIICKRDSITKSREMATEILEWLFKHGSPRVITNCPTDRPKIQNFCKKLGFKEYKRLDNNIYYEVLSWV